MDRQSAQRTTIIAQAAAVLGAGAIGWAILTQSPADDAASGFDPVALIEARPQATSLTSGQAQTNAAAGLPPEHLIDVEGVAQRLSLIAEAPEADEVAPVTPDTDMAQGGDEQPPTLLESRIRYSGMILSGTRRLAIVSLDDRQTIVGMGQRLSALGDEAPVVESVSANALRIRNGRQILTISRADREGPSITSVAGLEVGETPEGLGEQSEEDKARAELFDRRRASIKRALEAGNIDERQADRLLANIDREQEGGNIRERADRRPQVDIDPSERGMREGTIRAGRIQNRGNRNNRGNRQDDE